MSNPVVEITDAIGRDRVCLEAGVKPRILRHHRKDGRFPAEWLELVESWCLELGQPVPRDHFKNFRKPPVAIHELAE